MKAFSTEKWLEDRSLQHQPLDMQQQDCKCLGDSSRQELVCSVAEVPCGASVALFLDCCWEEDGERGAEKGRFLIPWGTGSRTPETSILARCP